MNRASLYKKKPSNHVGKHTVYIDVKQILRDLFRNKSILHFTSLQDESEFLAGIKRFDLKQQMFNVKIIPPKNQTAINVLPGAYKVTCVIHSVVYHFEVQLARIDLDERVLYVVSFPTEMQTLQRREVYRLTTEEIPVLFEDCDGKAQRGQLHEISVLGLKVEFPKSIGEQYKEGDFIQSVQVCLNEQITITCNLKVTRLQTDFDSEACHVWGLFKQIGTGDQNKLSIFIVDTQRNLISSQSNS